MNPIRIGLIKHAKPRLIVGAVALAAVFGVGAAGCKRDATQKPLTAEQVLQRMVEAYQGAATYEDAGEIVTRVVEAGRLHEEPRIPYSVAFARPNKLRIQSFDGALISDGDRQYGVAPSSLPRQVLQLAAPLKYTDQNYLADNYLYTAMTMGLEHPQIMLLMAEDPLKALLKEHGEPRLMESEAVDDRPCYRVEADSPDGTWSLWIDQESFVLRRVSFPTDAMKRELSPDAGIERLEVWAELTGARLGGSIDPTAFSFEAPADSHLVKWFVTPIPPARPENIGQTIGEFAFTTAEGGEVNRAALADKIAVLTFWITSSPFCQETMPHVQAVEEKFKDNPLVTFLAVSTDESNVPDGRLTEALDAWGVKTSVVRDAKRQYESVFGIPGWPTTYVIGPDSKVHFVKIGAGVDYTDLADAIETLAAGGDVAARTIAHYDLLEQDYQRRLALASEASESAPIEIPRAVIAPRKLPDTLDLAPAWDVRSLESPGAVLVVSADENDEAGAAIYVLDQYRRIARLNAAGEITLNQPLAIPDDAVVSFLRTARDESGKRYFLGSSPGQQQVHLFDADWKPLWSYPDTRHQGIWDVCFTDLNADQEPELLVGYWGQVGLQGVSLTGEALWKDRRVENVTSLAFLGPQAPAGFRAVAVDGRTSLIPVAESGELGPEARVLNRAITTVAAADFDRDGIGEMCGLALLGLGRGVAIGLDAAGAELWEYPLPEGEHRYQVERIVAAQFGREQFGWLIPGADGSIHFVGRDGRRLGVFQYGEEIRGLATAQVGGESFLIVSSQSGVAAWKISPRAQ